MKTFVYILLTMLSGLQVAAQNRYTTIYDSPYVETHVSPDYNLILQAGATMQARYDNNKEFRNKLIKWVFDLKAQTDDKQFLDAMDAYYKQLRSFDDQDFGQLGDELDKIKNNIEEEIDKSNTREKELPQKLWVSGNANLKAGNYKQAINDFSSLIEIKPNVADAYLWRGICYSSVNDFSTSLMDLTKYIDLKPNDQLGYKYRGIASMELKDYRNAMADFNKSIELNPNDFISFFDRARVKSELGDYYGSISDNSKAIEIKPSSSMAYNNRGWARFLLKDYKTALADLNKAIELDKGNSIAFDSRQEIKFALNDLEGCINDCNSAIDIDPKCANAYLFKGRVYYKKANKIKACENWSKAGELGESEAYELISKYCK